ncbi:hypothetical protein ACFST9_03055 [Hymenobacter monticola]|uniref:STAS/SEC14 domain-containing protein n=1 Tax=Hymenobacter monticola TaxID=1705399 RepID=A0ABY4B5S9_9BACT|nr:hypothetical protein [Hymenobacter monticola]UOE33061.1 hypothetical protein MTP16_18270 [Hymenobacter monticola]
MNSLPRAQETLYFQNAAGKVFHHPLGYARLAWSSERPPLDHIKAFYEQVLALLLNTNARKILSDHGQRTPLPAAAQSWLTENWIPRAMSQARTRHCAIVEGADPMHRLSTQSVVSSSPSGFVFQRFSTVEDAESWLRSVAV